jgi:hypothetical protein
MSLLVEVACERSKLRNVCLLPRRSPVPDQDVDVELKGIESEELTIECPSKSRSSSILCGIETCVKIE